MIKKIPEHIYDHSTGRLTDAFIYRESLIRELHDHLFPLPAGFTKKFGVERLRAEYTYIYDNLVLILPYFEESKPAFHKALSGGAEAYITFIHNIVSTNFDADCVYLACLERFRYAEYTLERYPGFELSWDDCYKLDFCHKTQDFIINNEFFTEERIEENAGIRGYSPYYPPSITVRDIKVDQRHSAMLLSQTVLWRILNLDEDYLSPEEVRECSESGNYEECIQSLLADLRKREFTRFKNDVITYTLPPKYSSDPYPRNFPL